MRVRAYVDGFNFYKGSCAVAGLHAEATGEQLWWKWLDVGKLCSNIASRYWGEVDVTHVAYCTALVKPRHPRDTEPVRQSNYLKALEAKGVDVVYGTFKRRSRWRELTDAPGANLRAGAQMEAKVRLPGEKGSDVNLATRLLRDYYTMRGDFDASLVVSNDYDLWEPVETLRRGDWPLGVVSPHGEMTRIALRHNSRTHPHFAHLMTVEDLVSAPLEDPVVGTVDGDSIALSCPPSWRQEETPPQ